MAAFQSLDPNTQLSAILALFGYGEFAIMDTREEAENAGRDCRDQNGKREIPTEHLGFGQFWLWGWDKRDTELRKVPRRDGIAEANTSPTIREFRVHPDCEYIDGVKRTSWLGKTAVDLRWVALATPYDEGRSTCIAMCGAGNYNFTIDISYDEFMPLWLAAKR